MKRNNIGGGKKKGKSKRWEDKEQRWEPMRDTKKEMKWGARRIEEDKYYYMRRTEIWRYSKKERRKGKKKGDEQRGKK